jgi:hypothetical protein
MAAQRWARSCWRVRIPSRWASGPPR